MTIRVAHLSTRDIEGGAARAAYRLHCGLRSTGHDSKLLTSVRTSDDPSVTAIGLPDPSVGAPAHVPVAAATLQELFSDEQSPLGHHLIPQLPEVDVIHLHWVADFVDYASFFGGVPQQIPVVWTLHDMNAFTGGCHYDSGCGRFADSCGACPKLQSSDPGDLSRRIWERKREIFDKVPADRLQLVAPSRWLSDEIRRSSLLQKFKTTVIPYGLDTDAFAPRDRDLARDVLGIPRGADVLLFVADYLSEHRKGFDTVTEAIRRLRDTSNLHLVFLGQGHMPIDVPIAHHNLGYVKNDRLLSLVYSAADLFVTGSTQDVLGQTVLESIACGVPVVGFDVGGNRDMIRPGTTGLLAAPGDPQSLSDAITALLRDRRSRQDMSQACRSVALAEYGLQVQAEQYLRCYDRLIADSVTLGANWQPLEVFNGEAFRWVDNDAELVINGSGPRHRSLSLEIESGPGLDCRDFELQLRQECGGIVARSVVSGRRVVSLPLPETPPGTVYTLHVDGGGRRIPNDPRILNFRVFRFGWI